jgi:hypothetical protein
MKELAFAGSFPFFGWRREWPGENNKITLPPENPPNSNRKRERGLRTWYFYIICHSYR